MYLSLIPTDSNVQALRRIAPKATEFHCTIIHSDAKGQRGLPVPPIPLGYVAKTTGLSKFANGKVLVIKLDCDLILHSLRFKAEQLLIDRNIPWSQDFSFSPHITLGSPNSVLHLLIPTSIAFDKLLWVY